MKRLLCIAVVLSFAATSPASAQSFGEVFPVTNTRYGAAIAVPQLANNGQDFFLFWSSERKVRATKLRDEEPRGGHVIFEDGGAFATAWLGDRFFAVTSRSSASLLTGRILDADAQPVGPNLTYDEFGFLPRVAVGSSSILITYFGNSGSVRSLVVGRDGKSIGASPTILASGGTGHAVARNGDGFVAVLSDDAGIRAISLDRQGRIVSERALPVTRDSYRPVALASNGTKSMAVWCDRESVTAAIIDENGNFGTPLVIDTTMSQATAPAVIWTGGGWTVAYEGPGGNQALRTRVAQLDWTGQRVLTTEESPEGRGSPTLAVLGDRVLAAWRSVSIADGSASVVELPLAQNTPRVATYSAMPQSMLATATSADATLIVWSERVDGRISLRSGLRRHDGSWNERELATFAPEVYLRALAASDGRQFVIVPLGPSAPQMIRLDENGRPVGSPVTLPIRPDLMAWNGTHYALVGWWQQQPNAVLLKPSGELSSSITIPEITFNATALASDGNGFFLAGDELDCPFILCIPVSPRGVRLGPDLQRIDASDIIFSDEYGVGQVESAVWNGSEYVLLYGGDDGYSLSRVPSSPAASIETSTIPGGMRLTSMVARSDGSLAIAGLPYPTTVDGINRVFVRNANGTLLRSFEIEKTSPFVSRTHLAALPNGGFAYLSSRVQDAAPHHGTSHVMMAIAQSSLPPRPGAPYVDARLEGNNISVDWTAASGTVNGYRLEYRVDDGSWNELDQWFSPGSFHTNIRRPAFGTKFAIRMRAFNDGGVSAYSAAAVTNPGRRRAVR